MPDSAWASLNLSVRQRNVCQALLSGKRQKVVMKVLWPPQTSQNLGVVGRKNVEQCVLILRCKPCRTMEVARSKR